MYGSRDNSINWFRTVERQIYFGFTLQKSQGPSPCATEVGNILCAFVLNLVIANYLWPYSKLVFVLMLEHAFAGVWRKRNFP